MLHFELHIFLTYFAKTTFIMKNMFNLKSILSFVLIISIMSCQNEPIQSADTAPSNALETDAPLVGMIRSAAANDVSYDNSLDDSDCFSIALPVTILIADVPMVIEDLASLEALSDLLDALADDDVEFVFPITLIFSDYSEVVVQTQEVLEEYINSCVDSTDGSDDSESYSCVDFVYPISISTYDENGEFVNASQVLSETDLYELFDDYYLSNDNFYYFALDYPVTLVFQDGSEVAVYSDAELEAAFMDSQCYDDSMDDTGDNDLGMGYCSVAELTSALTDDCLYFIADSASGSGMFLDFDNNGAVSILADDADNTVLTTTTFTVTDDASVMVLLTINDLPADFDFLSGEWLVTYCDDDILALIDSSSGYALLLVDNCQ